MDRRTFALPLLLIAALATPARPAGAAGTDADRAILKATEATFASTVAEKNKEKFAAMLDDDAVFVGPSGVKRGKVAIAQSWSAFFADDAPSFEWHAATVELTGDRTIALTRGPWVIRSKGKDGKVVEQRGTFNSVWRKGQDGSWKIVFDAGCPCEDPVK